MQHRATGLRIREKRRELGVKQNALAARVGVSAAYLNLIESNKRGVGGALLAAIGKELGLTLDQLDGTAERRLRETLEEMARDPELAAPDLSEARPGATEEYIARYPAWARLTARLHGKWREATETAEAMSDRLSHDPALSAAVHAMLTEITALRSTSEILAEPDRPERPEMDAAQRRRFEQIMFEQSSRLAETGAALAAYFDEAAETRRRRTPAIDAEEALDALEDLDARIEDLAIDARARLGERAPDVASGDLVALLEAAVARPPDLPAEAGWLERRDALALSLARAFFEAEFGALIEDAHRAAGPRRAEAAAPADRTAPETEAAMRDELARRLADALTLPAERLLPLGRSLGWDVEALGRAVDGDVALAMRRVACLGALGGPRAAHVAVDASGGILTRRGAIDLTPRSRRLDCPVWPVHRAPPGRPLASPVRDPEDVRALAVAWARRDGMSADMLIFDPAAAAASVYAALAAGKPADVGPDCRICAHQACRWRREPSVLEA